MIECKIFDNQDFQEPLKVKELREFLSCHLAQYGDPESQIQACLEYAFSSAEGKGGIVAILRSNNRMIAATVVNHTGMSGYIPEEQLVYIAVHKDYRGQGWGKKILQYTLDHTTGSMALHVEYDNPARFLYERLGFTTKYAEMRRPAQGIHG